MLSNGGGLHPFHFDRTWRFDVPPVDLWKVVSDTGSFRHWWPWLRALSGPGLVAGGRNRCEIRAPIPYTLRFTVEVVDVVSGRLVEARVEGDLNGPARLEVNPGGGSPDAGFTDAGGTTVRLAWEMELRRPLLRAAARVGRPVMEWGHDWVVANGVEQFVNRALSGMHQP